MKHAVIFDIDDTLLHSMAADDKLYRQAVADVLGNVHFRASLDEYDHVSDTGILRQLLEDNGIDATSGAFERIRGRFLNLLEMHLRTHGPFAPIDGAADMLSRVRALPTHRVALATGCWRASAELKLSTAGFDVEGLPLATSDDAVERVAIMRHALGQLGDGFTSVTYYGDGSWDLEACRQLGWTFRAVGPALGGLEAYHREFRD